MPPAVNPWNAPERAIASDIIQDQTGTYSIAAYRLNNPPGATTLILDDPATSATIAARAEFDVYSVDVQAGATRFGANDYADPIAVLWAAHHGVEPSRLG